MKTEIINNQKVKIYDNNGKTWDQYTAVYLDQSEYTEGTFASVGMSTNPFQGFGQHCIATPGKHLGKHISFSDLPADCQKFILQDLTEENI